MKDKLKYLLTGIILGAILVKFPNAIFGFITLLFKLSIMIFIGYKVYLYVHRKVNGGIDA